jgi:hypothetical protein
MTGLETLLDDAAGHPAAIDIAADLRRGHRALRRRRTRWAAAGMTGGLVVVGAAGYAAWPRQHEASVTPATDPTSTGPIRTEYYVAPPAPDGWKLEGAKPYFLSMIPADSASTNIWSFDGKVVVMLHEASGPSFGFGPTTEYDGRTFYDNERDTDSSILAVRLDDGRWLQVQYPKDAGLRTREMIEFLDGVRVLPAA